MMLKRLGMVLIWVLLPFVLFAQNENSISGDHRALMDLYNATDGDNWRNNSGWGGAPETMGDWYGVEIYTSGPDAGRVKELNLSGYPEGRGEKGSIDDNAPIGNNLTGNFIPDSFGNLKKMTHLRLKGNYLTARVDNWIQDLTNIEWISLSASTRYGGQGEVQIDDLVRYNHSAKDNQSNNKFTGSLPDLSGLTNLEMIEIANSNLTGNLPDMPTSIRAIFLTNSKMTGSLPEWNGCTNLTHIYLGNRYDDGDFIGGIPDSWKTFVKTAWFEIDGNSLSGDFPQMDDWEDLRLFAIGAGNDLTGDFPNWIWQGGGKHEGFHSLMLGAQIGGQVREDNPGRQSAAVWNYPKFDSSIPDENRVSGPLPQWVADLGLIQVWISNNNHTGEFPSPWRSDDLRWIRADGNNFEGDLPLFTHPVHNNFRYVEFHNNQFSGDIPEQYADFESTGGAAFSLLRLDNNQLDGNIPLGLFGNGWEVRLENNKYTPKNLVPIMSQNLSDVSYLPQKPFGSSSTVSEGSTIDKSSIHYTGNQYQWLKNGSPISGETSHSINTSSYGTGTYVLEVTHPEINFTFESEPVEVTTDGSGGGNDDPAPPNTPSLNSPSDGATNVSITPTFQWSSVDADSYEISVERVDPSNTIVSTGVSGTSYTLTGELENSTRYRWRVRSIQDDLESSWTSYREFTTAEDSDGGDDSSNVPAAPQLQAPAENDSTVSLAPRFEWNAVDADYYILHVSGTSPSEMVIEVQITDTSYTPGEELIAERTHHWRVRAIKDGVEGEWSPIREFTTGIEIQDTARETELNQNYPNPFNPSTQIRFTLSEAQQISLKVYDMSGRLVASIIDGSMMTAGTHNTTFNANGLASGVYFYRMISDSEVITRKMTLMK